MSALVIYAIIGVGLLYLFISTDKDEMEDVSIGDLFLMLFVVTIWPLFLLGILITDNHVKDAACAKLEQFLDIKIWEKDKEE